MRTIRRLSAPALLLAAAASASCGEGPGPVSRHPGGSAVNPQPIPVVPRDPSLVVQDVNVARTASSVSAEPTSANDGSFEAASPRCLSNDVADAVLVEQGPVSEGATFTIKLTETCGEEQNIHVALHTSTGFRLQDAPTSIRAHETVALSVIHAATDTKGEDVDLLIVTDSDPGAMVVSLHAVTL